MAIRYKALSRPVDPLGKHDAPHFALVQRKVDDGPWREVFRDWCTSPMMALRCAKRQASFMRSLLIERASDG